MSGHICTTCGKPGGACRWVDDPTICMRRQLDAASAALAMADEALADLIRPFNLITDSALRGYPDTPQPRAILKARAAREAIGKAREG